MNDKFNELVKVTMSEKQALTENSDSIHQEMTDGSAKICNFFHDNKSPENIERKYTTTRIKSRNFCRISHTLASTRKISTTEISSSMFIC